MLEQAWTQHGGGIDTGRISGYKDEDASANFVKTRMLVAGLAGLGRLSDADVERLPPDIGYRPGYTSRWTKAIDQAAQPEEAGTVLLLPAVGMQGPEWLQLPHAHLLHLVSEIGRPLCRETVDLHV